MTESGVVCFAGRRLVPFVIDAADLEAVSHYGWRIETMGYPATLIGKRPARRHIRLHEFLLGPAPPGLEWDHKSRNKMDNRRANLRAVTHQDNCRNASVRSDNSSGFPGIGWDRQRNKWMVRIGTTHIGRYSYFPDAVAARMAAERAYWRPSGEAS